MATFIDWKGKEILACKNSNLEGLREEMVDIIRKNNIKLNDILQKLIDRLDEAALGWGFDLSDYVFSKGDFLIFMDLVRKGINKHYHEIPNLPQSTKDLLENFYNELVKISETFDNPKE